MPGKKRAKTGAGSIESAARAEVTLMGVARTLGTTLGTAAAKAEDAAKELETFSHAVRKSTLATTRKLYKRVKKSLRARTVRRKAGTKKQKSPKKRAGKSGGPAR